MLFLRRFALRHWFRRSWTQEADNWEAEWTAMLLNQGQARSKRRVRLGDKPKLWDLACPAPVSEKITGSWKEVMVRHDLYSRSPSLFTYVFLAAVVRLCGERGARSL